MKSFNKILCLVLTLTMMVSLVAMPSAFAAIKYPVGDTSNYEVAATFVNASEGDLENAEAGSTAYLKLELKNISTLNSGYVTVALDGATFVSETDKLTGVFAKDSDLSAFAAGSAEARYGLSTATANLTSTNKKVKYYAFPAPTDLYLALYEIKIDDAATEVTATVSHALKVGDANGATGNQPATAEGIKLTNDTLAIGDPDPVYRYIVKWAVSDANDVVFPAGTTDEEITSQIKVYKTTLEDGVVVDTKEMTEGYSVVLNDGIVTVTIAENPNPDIVCDISYSIAGPGPVVTYKYSAAWKGMTTTTKTFPENTTDDAIKSEVVVYMTTLEDDVEVKTEEMTAGYSVVLNDGVVTVTIDDDFNADVTCGLTYTIDEPVPEYDYDIDWNVTPEFMYGTSDAYIMSCIKVTKYTFVDGEKVNTEVITTGYSVVLNVVLNDGDATVTVGDKVVTLKYTILDKVEYKNAKIVADNVEYDFELAEEYVAYHAEVTVEKWVNDAKADVITLERDRDYVMTVTFSENSNDGKFDAELTGGYDDVANPQSVTFERTCPPVFFADVSAHLTQTEFPEGVTEEEIVKTVVVTGTVKVGNLPAENKTLKNNVDYITSVRLDEKIVILNFASEDVNEIILDFTITPAKITYKNAAAGLSDSVFGSVPTAEEIISRLSVKAEKYKDDVFSDVVEITSENYDLTIGENEVTISFKGAYAELEDVIVEFTVKDYGDPVITVDGTISADGKADADIIAEAWTLISAVRDILTDGIVTGSETLDKAALETLGVVANYADGKVTFAYKDAIIAEVSVSIGKLQFASEDTRTAATEFIKFVGATLKNVIKNIKIKADTFQIITLNDEWISLSDAIEAGTATVTYGGVTYDNTNIADADAILVSGEDSVSLTVEYDNAITDIEVSLLEVPTDYANEANESPIVSITTDKAQVQTGTPVVATVYVDDLVGNVETGSVSVLFSNAEVTEDDIVAADGFNILSKTVSGNEINVVFTIKNAAYDAGAGIFTFTLDTTNSDVNAKLGLAINNYALTRIVDMGGYNDFRPINATIGNNVEVTISAEDILGYDYEVFYKSGKTVFYTDADAVADVKVLAYPTINGVRDENQTPSDVTTEASINANNGVITVNKDGIRVTTLTYTIYEVAFEQVVAIETIGSVADAKFTDNVTVKLDGAAFSGANVALNGRTIKVSVAGIKAVGTYEIAVAVPGYTTATVNVVVSKKPTNDGYDAAIVTGSKIYAGDINGDNRIDAVDFSDVAGKYGQAKETQYDLYTGNTSTTIDNLDVTTLAHYFIELARGMVSVDGTTITPYAELTNN